MAKNKSELLKDAVRAGLAPETATEDDFTGEQLERMLDPTPTAWKGSLSARKPLVAPDGHVTLSQEDIDARQ